MNSIKSTWFLEDIRDENNQESYSGNGINIITYKSCKN